MLAQRRGTQPTARTAWAKYATYLLLVVAVLGIAEAGRMAFTALVIVILGAALIEFYRAAALPHAATVALLAAALVIAGAALAGGAPVLYPAALAAALGTLAVGALSRDPRSGASAAVWGVAGLIAIATPGAHLLLLAGNPRRFTLFAFLFLVVCGADAFAELAGRRWPIGRGFLKASPDKTIAGLVAGIFAALAIALAVHQALRIWSLPQAMAYGLALGLAGTLGDLVASSIKRALGIKDFGSALARHGGVLDRFDSLIFAAAPFYWLVGG
jgi:phosphatidate cytidylyltransferase